MVVVKGLLSVTCSDGVQRRPEIYINRSVRMLDHEAPASWHAG